MMILSFRHVTAVDLRVLHRNFLFCGGCDGLDDAAQFLKTIGVAMGSIAFSGKSLSQIAIDPAVLKGFGSLLSIAKWIPDRSKLLQGLLR
jgi:hypothetical protein